ELDDLRAEAINTRTKPDELRIEAFSTVDQRQQPAANSGVHAGHGSHRTSRSRFRRDAASQASTSATRYNAIVPTVRACVGPMPRSRQVRSVRSDTPVRYSTAGASTSPRQLTR